MDNADDNPNQPFTPVARRPRHDGWTPDRQFEFIQALADTGCVEDAARHVGMSVQSAYQLRRQPGSESFQRAWGLALRAGLDRLADAAMSRALHGVARPIYQKGELVGEYRHFDERLTMFLLRTGNPARFGDWIGKDATTDLSAVRDLAVTLTGFRAWEDALADEMGEPRPDRTPPPAEDDWDWD